jgi:ketosteroid isomerase-like protein
MNLCSRIVTGFVVALFAPGAISAFAASLPPDLASAVKSYDRATIESDIPTLERLFADDYVLVNSDASVENKQQAIADFRMAGFRIDPYTTTEPVNLVWDNGAVVSGIVSLSWTQDGKHQQRLIHIAHVWAKRKRAWQMVYTQVTRVPQ